MPGSETDGPERTGEAPVADAAPEEAVAEEAEAPLPDLPDAAPLPDDDGSEPETTVRFEPDASGAPDATAAAASPGVPERPVDEQWSEFPSAAQSGQAPRDPREGTPPEVWADDAADRTVASDPGPVAAPGREDAVDEVAGPAPEGAFGTGPQSARAQEPGAPSVVEGVHEQYGQPQPWDAQGRPAEDAYGTGPQAPVHGDGVAQGAEGAYEQYQPPVGAYGTGPQAPVQGEASYGAVPDGAQQREQGFGAAPGTAVGQEPQAYGWGPEQGRPPVGAYGTGPQAPVQGEASYGGAGEGVYGQDDPYAPAGAYGTGPQPPVQGEAPYGAAPDGAQQWEQAYPQEQAYGQAPVAGQEQPGQWAPRQPYAPGYGAAGQGGQAPAWGAEQGQSYAGAYGTGPQQAAHQQPGQWEAQADPYAPAEQGYPAAGAYGTGPQPVQDYTQQGQWGAPAQQGPPASPYGPYTGAQQPYQQPQQGYAAYPEVAGQQQAGSAEELDAASLVRGGPPRRKPGRGWRRAVHAASFGLVNPGESADEKRRNELVARARTHVAGGHHRVAVLSLKGGVGKTTTTVALGSMLASLRGDRILAVDANPDRGTLSDKVRLETAATIRDLLNERHTITRYADIRGFTSQALSRLEILASDRDPAVSEAFSENDYREVSRLLEHYYSICITDCGTGLLHSAMRGVLGLADQVVLVSSPSVDGARSASATLDWLEAHEYGYLVRGAVVVLSMVRTSGKSSVDLDRLEQHFASRCRAVVRVPWDPHLEEGAEVDLDRLAPGTRDSYLRLGATVGEAFAWPR
ncbi:AAA family ATPase [Nocardiopsis halophila]|uniref:AAA family ATPase n=1 Tax=Nocardiopsis halophila TaxID=141692 RepID=UPI000A02E24C